MSEEPARLNVECPCGCDVPMDAERYAALHGDRTGDRILLTVWASSNTDDVWPTARWAEDTDHLRDSVIRMLSADRDSEQVGEFSEARADPDLTLTAEEARLITEAYFGDPEAIDAIAPIITRIGDAAAPTTQETSEEPT